MTSEIVKYVDNEINHHTDTLTALQKYCNFLTKNKWDADDLYQETLLKAFKAYHLHAKVQPSLLKKIAYHQWIDVIRKRTFEVTTDKEMELFGEYREDYKEYEEIDMILHLLTPKQAVIFVLKEAFLYQSNEIAQIMQTTETAVKAALRRARKRISFFDTEEEIVDEYSNEEDELLQLIYHSLQTEDPTLLIQLIPSMPLLLPDIDVKALTPSFSLAA
ncbi:sigma factor-like helix-turn-helix DNA-binding protein [Priestia taiwanensis]|uniref:DNA-directed RNA polymerase sigma-70 factor n=1 Tax=Priestia taiwanensis TaxID=1347902 RepID=A0A917ANF5_9BACI|nr:sigma factor-like helix-turn-helix DNA-binding protein [Priestia taiwanensis]MBM7362401.1 RNA polymerase sigma-70 factor (ECF subfamily) [Priestia taiwanensis]GGE61972.1 DNA-directed RNA polymerase sigma-70 factor [Priestia taiwanensis]